MIPLVDTCAEDALHWWRRHIVNSDRNAELMNTISHCLRRCSEHVRRRNPAFVLNIREPEGDQRDLKIPFPWRDELVMGRSKGCTVRLNDPTVSRRQLRITPREDFVLRLEHLGGAAVTFVNRTPIISGSSFEVIDDIEFRFGRTRVRLSRCPALSPLPDLELVLVGVRYVSQRHKVDEEMLNLQCFQLRRSGWQEPISLFLDPVFIHRWCASAFTPAGFQLDPSHEKHLMNQLFSSVVSCAPVTDTILLKDLSVINSRQPGGAAFRSRSSAPVFVCHARLSVNHSTHSAFLILPADDFLHCVLTSDCPKPDSTVERGIARLGEIPLDAAVALQPVPLTLPTALNLHPGDLLFTGTPYHSITPNQFSFPCELIPAHGKPCSACAELACRNQIITITIKHLNQGEDFTMQQKTATDTLICPANSDPAMPVPPAAWHDRLAQNLELPLRIELARSTMPMKRLLTLQSGDVLTLEKRLHDPIFLMSGDHKVAEGILVQADGELGMRITRINRRKEESGK